MEPVDVWIKAMADQQVQDITPVYYHVLLALRDPDEDELDAVRLCTRTRLRGHAGPC